MKIGNRIRAALFATLCAIAVTALAQAPADTYETADAVLQEDFDLVVEADGRFTLERFKRMRPKNPQGAEALAQQHFDFSESLESFTVVEAYTLTKDGRKLPVTDIRTTSSPVALSAREYGDHKITTLAFPAVEPGVELVFRVRKTQLKPLFPGAFFFGQSFPREYEFQQVSVRVRAQPSLPLYTEAVDMKGGEIEPDATGRRQWLWTYRGGAPQAPELGSVNNADYSARVAITSFASYADVARAYSERAAPMAAITPAIRAKADELTAGLTDARAQAAALHRWVTDEVRYLLLHLGFGGVVPHAAEQVLRNKYGDCKDVTTLLQALLAAKGIRSEPVLVNNTPGAYVMPKIALPVGHFNHAVLHLPDLGIYIDGTARFAPFDVLPGALAGKQALLVGDDKQAPRVVTLPMGSATRDVARTTTTLTLDAKGHLSGEARMINSGMFDWVQRMVGDGLPAGMAQQIGSAMLQRTGQTGSGAVYRGTPRDMSKPYELRAVFSLPDAVTLPGPGSFALPRAIDSIFSMRSLFALFVPERRRYSMPFENGTREEIVTLTLPDGLTVSELPQSLSAKSPFARFDSTWTQAGRTVSVKRALVFDHAQPVLQPDEYLQLRAMMETMARDLRAPIRFR